MESKYKGKCRDGYRHKYTINDEKGTRSETCLRCGEMRNKKILRKMEIKIKGLPVYTPKEINIGKLNLVDLNGKEYVMIPKEEYNLLKRLVRDMKILRKEMEKE